MDSLVFERGLAESREKARALIMAGLVEVDGVRVEKPGHSVPLSSSIRLKESSPPYVSRGGIKLQAAIERFSIKVEGMVLMDVGSSTGGFTDCLLQHGARKVIAVDVGHGQLHWKLRQNPRVRLMERTNIRYLKPGDIDEHIDGAAIDVSFISLKLVTPPVSELLSEKAFIIALIKPQFEVGKNQVGKGGVVRNPSLHKQVVEDLGVFFETLGWQVEGSMESPILGPKGNKEFFVYLRR